MIITGSSFNSLYMISSYQKGITNDQPLSNGLFPLNISENVMVGLQSSHLLPIISNNYVVGNVIREVDLPPAETIRLPLDNADPDESRRY
jgi:hypothetical protein